MTPKQQRFVDEYLIDLNATAAYKRAGYKSVGNSAEVSAARLLRNVQVAAAVKAAQDARSRATDVTAKQVLAEIALLAFSDIGQILDFSGTDVTLRPANEIPESARRALSSVKVKRQLEGSGDAAREVEVVEFRLWPKLEALEKMAKHLGLLKEHHHFSGSIKFYGGFTPEEVIGPQEPAPCLQATHPSQDKSSTSHEGPPAS